MQTVNTFNFEYNGATRKLRSRYLNLCATDLVAEGIGALFVGGSGLGKTHLARALGYAQCQRGHRVLSTTLAAMVNHLSAAEATKILHRALQTYQRPAILLADEVGYVSLRQPDSHPVFQVISVRHDKHKPTVGAVPVPATFPTGVLALPLFRAGAPVCPPPLTGHIDRGAGDALQAEMWRHRSWRLQVPGLMKSRRERPLRRGTKCGREYWPVDSATEGRPKQSSV